MSEMQSGLAVVWAVEGVTMTAGIVSATNAQKIQSLSCVRDTEKVYVKSDLGETVGRIDVDGKVTLTLSVIPCHATAPLLKATATTSFYAHLIAPGTKVTVADAQSLTSPFEGDFKLNRCTGNKTNTGVAVVELELEKYTDNDITVSVA